jgi:Fe-S-cluster containining protein
MSQSSEDLSSQTKESALPLVIAENIRYNCQGCGRCCTGWSVGVTAEDYAKVKDIDWGALHPDLANKELFVHHEEEFKQGLSLYPHHTKARSDGSCSFLIDNRCFIHSTLGEENKPRMCQLFPYTFVPTPAGIYVGVSFSSMAAARNLGELLTDQRSMLENMWQTAVAQQKAQGYASQEVASAAAGISEAVLANVTFDVKLVPGTPLSWDDYQIIEERMLSTLSTDQYPQIISAIIAMSEYLAEAIRLKSASQDLSALTQYTPNVERWLDQEPGFFESKVFSMLCFKNFTWPAIREKLGEQATSKSDNPFTEPEVMKAAAGAVMADKLKMPGLEQPVSVGKAKKHKIKALTPEIDGFLRRYLYLKIFSKTYFGSSLSGLSLISGYNNIAGTLLCALIYAKAHAMKNNSDELKIADLYEAFVLIEREGISLSNLPKDRAGFFDSGFSSVRLFTRIAGQISRSVAAN